MGTNSTFACQMPDGTFKAVYCHSDGNLSWNGVVLDRFHNSTRAARKIIKLGACSYLEPRLEPDEGEAHKFDFRERAAFCSVFYRRDRGDRVSAQSYDTLEELLAESDGLTYVWVNGDGWSFHGYADEEDELPDGSIPFRPLKAAIALCQKSQDRIAQFDKQGMTLEWRDAGCPHKRHETTYGPQFEAMPIGWKSDEEKRATRYEEEALF